MERDLFFCEDDWTQTHVYEVLKAQEVNRDSQTTVYMYISRSLEVTTRAGARTAADNRILVCI